MVKIEEAEALRDLPQGNQFVGDLPEMRNSSIQFRGSDNILFCDKHVRLVNSNILFNGNHAVVFLCENSHDYKLNVTLYHHSAFFVGRNNYFNGALNAILSE